MDLLGDHHGDHGDTAEKVTYDAENKCRDSDLKDIDVYDLKCPNTDTIMN